MLNDKDEYIAPGIHSRPLVISPSPCPHEFELQSLRHTIATLRLAIAERDAKIADLKDWLELEMLGRA